MGRGVTFRSECEDEWGGGSRRGRGPPVTDSSFSVGFAIQAPPPFPGGGEHGAACLLACLLAGRATGRLFLLPAVLLLAAAAALAVVVVLSCSLVVPAGMRDDGGRTREYYMCMRGGRRVGRCGGAPRGWVVEPIFDQSVCACRLSARSAPALAWFRPWTSSATMEPRGDASGTLLCDAEGGENLTAKTTRSETESGDGLNPTWSHTRTVPKL